MGNGVIEDAEEWLKFVKKDNFDELSITLANGDYYKHEAWLVIKDHPAALAQSIGITLITFFTHDGLLTVFQHAGIPIPAVELKASILQLFRAPSMMFQTAASLVTTPAIFIIIARLIWYVITGLMIGGVVLYIRRNGWTIQVITITLTILYFALTTFINGLGVNGRFKVPVHAFIFMFAVYAATALYNKFQTR